MSVSKTLADFCEQSHEIARQCRESGEPVLIKDSGRGDLVLMSLDAYRQAEARFELYRLLDEAETDFQKGDRGISVAAMRERLRA